MHTDILNNHLDQNVEVTTSNDKTFRGTLKLHDTVKEVVIIDGDDKYSNRRYGPVAINQKDIVTIREVLPRVEEDEDMDSAEDGFYKKDAYDSDGDSDVKAEKYMISPLAGHDHGTF